MLNNFIRGGAACGRTSLCANCASAHIVTGYRESEMVVICTEANPHLTVRFEVKECTKYDRSRPPGSGAPQAGLLCGGVDYSRR